LGVPADDGRGLYRVGSGEPEVGERALHLVAIDAARVVGVVLSELVNDVVGHVVAVPTLLERHKVDLHRTALPQRAMIGEQGW
jgi:hypothetical protein